jgi:hypothetical protein
MTMQEIETLVPGQKLTWTGRWRQPWQKGGATAYEMYAKPYGETVEFYEHTGEGDMHGVPLIVVQTTKGLERFSAAWLKKVKV